LINVRLRHLRHQLLEARPVSPAELGSGLACIAELDSNVVERAGSDGGGEHWAVIASLIETCKMNSVDPQAFLRDVLSKIVARHPMDRIDELLPFAYLPTAEEAAA
jgi:hypothetical protein